MERLESLGAIPFGDPIEGDVDNALAELQAKIGGELPDSLAAILKKFHGSAVTFGDRMVYRPLVASRWCYEDGTAALDLLYGVHGESSICKGFNTYEGRLPDGVVPIGDAPGGNLICLVVRGPQSGRIYFWDHEDERAINGEAANDFGNMTLAAESFDNFLGSLSVQKSASEETGGHGVVGDTLPDDFFDR